MSVAVGSDLTPIDLNVADNSTPQEDTSSDCISHSKEKDLTVEIGQKLGFDRSAEDPILNEIMAESGGGLGLQ